MTTLITVHAMAIANHWEEQLRIFPFYTTLRKLPCASPKWLVSGGRMVRAPGRGAHMPRCAGSKPARDNVITFQRL